MARFWPAAVRSRIQSPSLISQVTMQPAIGLPCNIEAEIASVSSTSMLSRLSLDHTFQARLAIGIAFHSIKGTFTAITTGLAENAINSEMVGSASGESLETCNADFFDSASGFAWAQSALMSPRLAPLKRSSSAIRKGSWAGSYSLTRLAQAKL